MPASHAASIRRNASSFAVPCPKNAGDDPTPPKLPQPRMTRVTTTPLPPSSAVGMLTRRRAHLLAWRVFDQISTVHGEIEEPAGPPDGDLSEPILPGEGESDYERYLRTDA